MYLSFSRYCSLHFRCEMLTGLFSEVVILVISGCPSEAIINCNKFHGHDALNFRHRASCL